MTEKTRLDILRGSILNNDEEIYLKELALINVNDVVELAGNYGINQRMLFLEFNKIAPIISRYNESAKKDGNLYPSHCKNILDIFVGSEDSTVSYKICSFICLGEPDDWRTPTMQQIQSINYIKNIDYAMNTLAPLKKEWESVFQIEIKNNFSFHMLSYIAGEKISSDMITNEIDRAKINFASDTSRTVKEVDDLIANYKYIYEKMKLNENLNLNLSDKCNKKKIKL